MATVIRRCGIGEISRARARARGGLVRPARWRPRNPLAQRLSPGHRNQVRLSYVHFVSEKLAVFVDRRQCVHQSNPWSILWTRSFFALLEAEFPQSQKVGDFECRRWLPADHITSLTHPTPRPHG